jgi:hypothetical protein
LKLIVRLRFFNFIILGSLFSVSTHAGIHDPTKPINELSISKSEQTVEVSYNLQSILVSPMRILAMINGQLVGTGSTIQGARVLAIGKNHVVLLYAGQKRVIYLFGKRLWKAH